MVHVKGVKGFRGVLVWCVILLINWGLLPKYLDKQYSECFGEGVFEVHYHLNRMILS
jgi:hypothetical protein